MSGLKIHRGDEFLGQIPDSRNDSRLGKELDERLIRMADCPEPDPMAWVWEDLIPAGYMTALIGDGGAGKSLFALRLALSVALGQPFLGRAVQTGNVLILDAELTIAEPLRRVHRLRRGLGLDNIPNGLVYMQLPESLGADDTRELCIAAIERVRPQLTIIDSLSVACAGMDLNGPEDIIELMTAMKTWGTCLVLDHVPKTSAANRGAAIRAYGTVFKFNLARSVLQLVSAESGARRLTHLKSNFGALQAPLGIDVIFDEETVVMEPIALDDAKLAAIQKVTSRDRVLEELVACGSEGAQPHELTAAGVELHTVRNILTKLRKEGLVYNKRGRWIAVAADEDDDGNVQ